MPNYFQLVSKVSGEPEPFIKIDREMCEHFNQPCDEVKYFADWYDTIGFRVAMGKSFDDILQEFGGYLRDDRTEYERNFYALQIEIVRYLKERFDTNAWARIGK